MKFAIFNEIVEDDKQADRDKTGISQSKEETPLSLNSLAGFVDTVLHAAVQFHLR